MLDIDACWRLAAGLGPEGGVRQEAHGLLLLMRDMMHMAP